MTATLLVLLVFAPTGIVFGDQLRTDDASLFSDDGYRIAHYRAALPDRPPTGKKLDTASLYAMTEERDDLVLVDVQAITVRPESREFGLSWLPTKARFNLPGSTWLPNVGYGELDRHMAAYLRTNLDRLTGGSKHKPLVFYCIVDCWMAWNAVKRASDLGYRNLYWYPEGTDGWGDAGLPLLPAEPVPIAAIETHDEDLGCPAGGDSHAFFACVPGGLPAALSGVARQSGIHGVMLFLETSHCPFCKRMRQGLLADASIVDYYRERFVTIPIDIESDAPLLAPDGSAVTGSEFARNTLGVHRTPTLVFLDPNGVEVFRHAGAIVDPRKFRGLADYVAGDHYERTGLREFLANPARPASSR